MPQRKNKFVRQRRGVMWGGYHAHPIPRTPTASRSLGNQVFENTVSRERIRVDNSSGRRVVQSHAGPCGPRRGARCCACKSLPANKLRHAAEKAEISGSCFSPSLFLFFSDWPCSTACLSLAGRKGHDFVCDDCERQRGSEESQWEDARKRGRECERGVKKKENNNEKRKNEDKYLKTSGFGWLIEKACSWNSETESLDIKLPTFLGVGRNRCLWCTTGQAVASLTPDARPLIPAAKQCCWWLHVANSAAANSYSQTDCHNQKTEQLDQERYSKHHPHIP